MDAPLLEKADTCGVLSKLKAAFAPIRKKWADSPATVPNMLFLALVFGIVSGVVAWLYSLYFEGLLELVWKVSPALVFAHRSRLCARWSMAHCRPWYCAPNRSARWCWPGLQVCLTLFPHAQIIPTHLVQPGLERLSNRYSWFPPLQKVRVLPARTLAMNKVGPGAPSRSTNPRVRQL